MSIYKFMIRITLVVMMSGCLFFENVAKPVRSSEEPAAQLRTSRRKVVVTFDDLPGPVSDVATLRSMTQKLLATITTYNIPAVAFVNEQGLYVPNEKDERIAILKLWLDSGVELGNHTFSHPRFRKTPFDEYAADIIRGETLSRMLMSERGKRLRYFRHPFLDTGATPRSQHRLEKFLTSRGYTVAPVTMDNEDPFLARVYAKALTKGDRETMKRVADDYVEYMAKMADYSEKLSTTVVGYEINFVLLVHANQLNADHFNRVAEMLKRRGYDFVTLEEALKDKAYQRGNPYVKECCISWLVRWAVAEKIHFAADTDTGAIIDKYLPYMKAK